MKMNKIVIKYGGISIQCDGIEDMEIPYNKIIDVDIDEDNNNIFGLDKQSLSIFKKIAYYMTKRLKGIDIDPEQPITVSWLDDIQDEIEQEFSLNMYEEAFNILKRKVEKSLNENLKGENK